MLLIVESLSGLDMAAIGEIYDLNSREVQMLSDYLRDDFFQSPGAFYALWRQEDACVAALRMESYLDGVLLEALHTRRECRNRGYATQLLKNSLAFAKKQGFFSVYAHIKADNLPSLAVHKHCGFVCQKESARLLDGTVTTQYHTYKKALSVK